MWWGQRRVHGGVTQAYTGTMALQLFEALRSVSEDENVMSLSEDMARVFAFTTDSSTINLWPAIIVLGLLALAIIPIYEYVTTGSLPDFPQSKNSYYTESDGYTHQYEGYRTIQDNTITGILDSIDTEAMVQRMKTMAGKVRHGIDLFKDVTQS